MRLPVDPWRGTDGGEACAQAPDGSRLSGIHDPKLCIEGYLQPVISILRPSLPVAVLIPRIRTINVRLSDDEYSALERFCAASGARSMSDLVRNTMQSLVGGANQKSALASSVDEYSSQVKDLEQKVATLAAEIAWLKAGSRPHHANEPSAGTETPGSNEAVERQPLDELKD